LPNRQRLVFEKAFLNEQKHSEIAEELELLTLLGQKVKHKKLTFVKV